MGVTRSGGTAGGPNQAAYSGGIAGGPNRAAHSGGTAGAPARATAPREIRVDIGELVLDGFRADPDRVAAAFEVELTRLVRERGMPADGPWTADVLSGLPPLPAGLSARRLGQELARAVHEGLSGRGEVAP
ncbi:hypothetical protein [Streptomyces sp. NPDC007929]|uniref:hypothetical protein n=1 Tax=unclassified Streptomyces TaxID=2593676 RepID=UPI0036E87360